MAISEKLNALVTEKRQRDAIVAMREKIRDIRGRLKKTGREFQSISDKGYLGATDNELKQVLDKAWNIITSAETSFEDTDITELLNWSE